MRNRAMAVLAVAVLVLGALFLPEHLLVWGDGQLLDRLHMDAQDQAREGFGESLQLTLPEKIQLLRGGQLTAMALDQEETAAQNALLAGGEAPEEEYDGYFLEKLQTWEDRVDALEGEVATLQTLGGLPELWLSDRPPDYYTAYGDFMYLDPETRMNFQVYRVRLAWGSAWAPDTREAFRLLDLLVDMDSGHILSFSIHWSLNNAPTWGSRDGASFGGAWRDYWGMDSVSTGWYSQRVRDMLENLEAQMPPGGETSAYDQITFLYGGQSLPIPLACQGTWSRGCSLAWNR